MSQERAARDARDAAFQRWVFGVVRKELGDEEINVVIEFGDTLHDDTMWVRLTTTRDYSGCDEVQLQDLFNVSNLNELWGDSLRRLVRQIVEAAHAERARHRLAATIGSTP